MISRLGWADAALVIALGALTLSLAWPTIKDRAFAETAAETEAGMEAVAARAIAVYARSGSWPAPTAPGELPPQLSAQSPDDIIPRSVGTLEWRLFTIPTVERLGGAPDATGPIEPTLAEGTESLGAVILHGGSTELRSDVLESLGRSRAFPTDSMVILLVEPPSADTGP